MLSNSFRNKSILVTGASGSIGSEIVKKLLKKKCKVVRAMSNDENGIYLLSKKISDELDDNLSKKMKKNKVRFLIGDIRDYKRNLEATKGIDIVIHAAAMKHVPICEYNPSETEKTNIIGTKNLIKASLVNRVKKFLFISTDKAANPNSIMGKSKLVGENLVFKANKINTKTKFSAIRFGNIIGSRGSVLPNFLSQIRDKKRLTITDKRVTRFFISIDLATKEIFRSLQLMNGNELFIIKNMKSFKIIDLAIALTKIFKFKKKIKTIGLQKGEKLHEELFTKKEFNKYSIKKNLVIIKKNNQIKKNKTKKKYTNNFSVSSEFSSHLTVNEIQKYLKKDLKIKI